MGTNNNCNQRYSGFFITGTNTGVGKTVVTSFLLTNLLKIGIKTIALKPIQTGVLPINNFVFGSPNTELYHKKHINNTNTEYNCDLSFIYNFTYNHYFNTINCATDNTNFSKDFLQNSFKVALSSQIRFLQPCSPHIAAELSDTTAICIKTILKQLGKVQNFLSKQTNNNCSIDTFLVEGAGGVIVPINEKETILDLIKCVTLPTIVVSDGALGSINSTLLTINALKSANVDIAGFIFSDKENIIFARSECNCKAGLYFDTNNTNLTNASTSKFFVLAGKDKKFFLSIDIKEGKAISNYKYTLCNNCLQKLIFYNNAQTIAKISRVCFLGVVPNINKNHNHTASQVSINNDNNTKRKKQELQTVDFELITKLLKKQRLT
ncbi:MAG: dethiobiotin synthase [Alphaproteobacteria bacterium]|nr:dethiobiotin synthase [Rickettsiales bacterium]